MEHVYYYLLVTGADTLYSKCTASSVVIQCGLRPPFPEATNKSREKPYSSSRNYVAWE